jgi:hypothetical protein
VVGDPGHLLRPQPQVQGVQHRTHRRYREISLEMFLVVPLKGRHPLVAGDPESAQRAGQLRSAPAHRGVARAAGTVAGPGDDLAVAVHGGAVMHDHAHGQRDIHHRAVHRGGPFQLSITA